MSDTYAGTPPTLGKIIVEFHFTNISIIIIQQTPRKFTDSKITDVQKHSNLKATKSKIVRFIPRFLHYMSVTKLNLQVMILKKQTCCKRATQIELPSEAFFSFFVVHPDDQHVLFYCYRLTVTLTVPGII